MFQGPRAIRVGGVGLMEDDPRVLQRPTGGRLAVLEFARGASEGRGPEGGGDRHEDWEVDEAGDNRSLELRNVGWKQTIRPKSCSSISNELKWRVRMGQLFLQLLENYV